MKALPIKLHPAVFMFPERSRTTGTRSRDYRRSTSAARLMGARFRLSNRQSVLLVLAMLNRLQAVLGPAVIKTSTIRVPAMLHAMH